MSFTQTFAGSDPPTSRSNTTRQFVGPFLFAAAVMMTSCTTYIQPTTCERGSTRCAGIHDARFCEYVATAVEGADCASLGLVETKHFCVVTTTACIDTNYAVREKDCKVVRYATVRDAMRAECPAGAPMFVSR